MKKLGILIILLIIAVSFSGCAEKPKPDEKAESYLTFSELFQEPKVTANPVTEWEAWNAQTQKKAAYDRIFGLEAQEDVVKLYERDYTGIGIGKDTAFLRELQTISHKNGFFPEKLYPKVFDIDDDGTISHDRTLYHLNYDHITVELHFMHFLAEKGKNGNVNTESDQKNFFNSHLKNWLIGTPSFTEKCEEFFIEEERKKGVLDEWQTYYRENIQLLKKFIESESIRFENMNCPAGANSVNIHTQLSSSTISSTDVGSEVISMNHGNYIERTADPNYQVTNLEVPENLQFLSVSVISADVSTGFELQLWDPHGRLRGARDATAGKSTILIQKTDEINIYEGTWKIAIWKKIESDFNYIISTGEIFSVYTIPLSPIKDTDFNFHLIGENPDWLEMNSISGTIELTLPDGIIGESKKTVQVASGEIKDIAFSLHANEIGEHTITVTAKSMGYPYFQYVDIDIIEEEKDFTPLDLCMVLDRSGSMDESMGDKTRMQGVKEAAKGVVNVLLPQDRVSIVSFSDTATTNIDLTSDVNRVKTKINAINADGYTSFGAGLETALGQFKAHGNPDHTPAILFMSDGEHNRAPGPEAYVTQCKNKDIPIFTVGFASSESEVDVTKLKMMAEETGGEYHFVSEIFDLQNIFLRLQHKASDWESIATYVGEVNEGETVTAGTFYVDPAIEDLRVTLNWPGSNLDLKLFNPNGRQVDFSASNVIYSGDTKPEYVIIKDPQSGTWMVKVYGKSIGSSEKYYVLVTKYEPEPTMDIQAEIRNIWTSDNISPIVLFGKNANLGQVLQADLDDDSFSDPLPSYDDRCLGDKNYDKSVISRFGEGDDKVRIVLDITGGTGFKPGSEGYIKILNPGYKITKIYDPNDYVGVQPPTMSLGTPTISTDYSGFGVVIDMAEGCVSWQGRGTCPACACRENTFRMEFLVEKVSIPADSEVIFADDFDTYATGSFPSSGGWNLKYNGMGDSYQVVDNSQSGSSQNSLKLEGEANWAASADHPLAETQDQVIFEADLKVTRPDGGTDGWANAYVVLVDPDVGWGTHYGTVLFGADQLINGKIPYNFGQWYHVKAKVDMLTRKNDVWIDDVFLGTFDITSDGYYKSIRLDAGNSGHTRAWFDNVKVYRGDEGQV